MAELKTLRERMANVAGGKATIHWLVPSDTGSLKSGGLPGGEKASPGLGGPGRYEVACDPARRNDPLFSASGATHVVNCPECIKHPRFAAEYQPAPNIEGYLDIPKEHREVVEAHEAQQSLRAQVAARNPPEEKPCAAC